MSPLPEKSLPGKLLVMHAGTHKTATSYIQSRLFANRELLSRVGVQLEYPRASGYKHKSLARALARGEREPWQRFLDQLEDGPAQAIISAEQFTQPVARPERHRDLAQLLAEAGYRLRVVIFLRDQPDYINARYVHSVRRLYHHLPFDEYVKEALASRRRVFDYEHLLTPLLDCPDIECQILPYSVAQADPFEQLMASQGWTSAAPWLPADPTKGNVQPGCRGVWLAMELGLRLEQLQVQGRSLSNTGAIVRRIAQREGWQDDRFYGFDSLMAARVSNHYKPGNDRLATRVWGCPWHERFPVNSQLKRRVFDPPPPNTREWNHLKRLVDEGLKELARSNPKLQIADRNNSFSKAIK